MTSQTQQARHAAFAAAWASYNTADLRHALAGVPGDTGSQHVLTWDEVRRLKTKGDLIGSLAHFGISPPAAPAADAGRSTRRRGAAAAAVAGTAAAAAGAGDDGMGGSGDDEPDGADGSGDEAPAPAAGSSATPGGGEGKRGGNPGGISVAAMQVLLGAQQRAAAAAGRGAGSQPRPNTPPPNGRSPAKRPGGPADGGQKGTSKRPRYDGGGSSSDPQHIEGGVEAHLVASGEPVCAAIYAGLQTHDKKEVDDVFAAVQDTTTIKAILMAKARNPRPHAAAAAAAGAGAGASGNKWVAPPHAAKLKPFVRDERTLRAACDGGEVAAVAGGLQPLANAPNPPADGRLVEVAQHLLRNGLAPRTRRTYDSAARHFLSFCAAQQLQPLPASPHTVVFYIAHLFSEEFAAESIRKYLTAVGSLHTDNGFDPQLYRIPIVKRVQKAAITLRTAPAVDSDDDDISSGARPRRFVVTADVVRQLVPLLSSDTPQHRLLLAICWVATTGMFRAYELLPESAARAAAEPDCVLRWQQVTLRADPPHAKFRLIKTKTNRISGGTVRVFHREALAALCAYMAGAPPHSGSDPLFLSDRGPLTWPKFKDLIVPFLERIGANPAGGLSFRAGGATSMAEANIEDSIIRSAGRWSSVVYQRYVRPSAAFMAAVFNKI